MEAGRDRDGGVDVAEVLNVFAALADEVWSNEVLVKWLLEEDRFPLVVSNRNAIGESFLFGVRPLPPNLPHITQSPSAQRNFENEAHRTASSMEIRRSPPAPQSTTAANETTSERSDEEFLLFTPCHYLGENRFTLAIATPSDPLPPKYFGLPDDVFVKSVRVVNVNRRMMVVNVQRLSNGMTIIETRVVDRNNHLRELKVLVRKATLDVVRGRSPQDVVLVASLVMENDCQFCIVRNSFQTTTSSDSGGSKCSCPRSMALRKSIVQSAGSASWMNQALGLQAMGRSSPMSQWALRLYTVTPSAKFHQVFSTPIILALRVHVGSDMGNPAEVARHSLALNWLENSCSLRALPSSRAGEISEPGTSTSGDKLTEKRSRDGSRGGSLEETKRLKVEAEAGSVFWSAAGTTEEQGSDKEKDATQRITPTCSHCGAMFSQEGHMKQHVELVHLKLKKFECAECGKLFGTAGNMRQHRLHVHENPDLRAFQCPVCGKNYKAKSKMLEHRRRVHES